jgi:rare lipoprotein A
MSNIKSAVTALVVLLFANVAKADPLTDALDEVFHPRGAVVAQTDVKSHKDAKRERTSVVFRVRGSLRDFIPGAHPRVVASTPAPPTTGGHVVWTSYYGHGEPLNRHTANGEVFNPGAMTAAHRTLPIGTKLLVSYHGRSVVVRVNDRGPAAWTGRSLDLTYGAARALGMGGLGWVKVARLS